MQITTPSPPAAQTAIQSKDPRIAYAFIRYPEKFNDMAHSILTHALRAGMRHNAKGHSIEPVDWVGYFTSYFSVGLFNVHLNRVKDLKLPGHYVIAVLSADDVYVPLRGITGIDFAGAFLKKDVMNRYLAELDEREKHYEQVLAIVRDWNEQNLPKSKTPPAGPDQGAAQ